MSPSRSTTPDASAWCIDADTRDNVIARRNVLAALWAGELMSLPDPARTAYAVEVHLADYEVSGDADVVAKIARDLNAKGVAISAGAVREKLCAFHRQALMQLGATD
jgi:hypothetical protein